MRHWAERQTRLWAALLIVGAAKCGFAAAPTKTVVPSAKPVRFEAWGFQIEVPRTAARRVLQDEAEAELSELYVFGDTTYFVRVLKLPPNTLTSTAIEQALQAAAAASSETNTANRWEIESEGGKLFKGVSRTMDAERDFAAAAEHLKKALRGRHACQSLAMAPLGDESSLILSIGVIGPKGRDDEIEKAAKFLAFRVSSIKSKAAEPKSTVPEKPTRVPAAEPRKPLAKGEIELHGVVESVAASEKSFTMSVNRIVLPGVNPIDLDPVRRKTVFVGRMPGWITAGLRVLVVGKNLGVGSPITADVLEKDKPNRPVHR